MIQVGDKVKLNISIPAVCAKGWPIDEKTWRAEREAANGKAGYVVVADCDNYWPYNVKVEGKMISGLFRNELEKS